MFSRVTRPTTVAALVVVFGLASLPACKKKPKIVEPDSPNTTPAPNPGIPAPNTGATRDPAAPRSPVFGGSDPRTAGMRVIAEGDLKQILLGLHSYEAAFGTFPGGYAGKDGTPGLSWRVAILPFIQEDNLYKLFKLDEAWDSPTNKPLISKMPKMFAPPRESTNGYTFYRGFTGPNTWLPPQQAARPGQLLAGAKVPQITDGTSNTIMVAEAYDPVIWTKPDEMQFDPNNPPKLGGVFASGFHAGLADGSVRFVRPGMLSPKALANAIQINDGNVVDWGD
jgi:hypothetical protein